MRRQGVARRRKMADVDARLSRMWKTLFLHTGGPVTSRSRRPGIFVGASVTRSQKPTLRIQVPHERQKCAAMASCVLLRARENCARLLTKWLQFRRVSCPGSWLATCELRPPRLILGRRFFAQLGRFLSERMSRPAQWRCRTGAVRIRPDSWPVPTRRRHLALGPAAIQTLGKAAR